VRIFEGTDLRSALKSRLASVRQEVHAENSNKLLNMNEDEYITYLVETHRVEPLVMHWDDMSVSDREEMIPAEYFPPTFDVWQGRRYPKQVVTYHIPFSGERDLLGCTPSTRILWSMEVDMRRDAVSFDVINWRDDADEIKREANRCVSCIRQQAENVCREVEGFNASFEAEVTSIVRARKEELLKQSGLLEQLGVPLKQAASVPETFAVPSVKRKVVVKPAAPSTSFTPEPALDERMYHEILKLCYDTGVEMERHPSVYGGKDEESLRDHFIMVLSPHFESVTGETFNKSGKTDVLIRHEKANVFVAECKFWNGRKGFHKTIDQLLGYLTWRDSKAAVVFFVRTKELAPVLAQIETVAAEHSCFVKTRPRESEGWFNFDFHLKEDSSRGVKLAVLCFHFPPLGE